MTGLYALLFKRLSRRRERARGEIGVAALSVPVLNDRSTAKSAETTANDLLLHFMAQPSLEVENRASGVEPAAFVHVMKVVPDYVRDATSGVYAISARSLR